MTFKEVFSLLYKQTRNVTYSSLTSDKVHTLECTIHTNIQNDSDKILVWDMKNDSYHDIEVSSILSIT